MTVVLEPDRKEIARYLGYHGVQPDEAVQQEIEYCVRRLQEDVTPRFVYQKFPLSISAGDPDRAKQGDGKEEIPIIRASSLEIHSRNLARNLQGCTFLYLMAATLGPAPDRLVKRASITGMSRAVIYQAAAAAMIETWCDLICQRISGEAQREGLYCRTRFSPGYGDVPLQLQRDFANILHMDREIGVGLTDTLLMTPSKSVTAFIGASPHRQASQERGCDDCSLQNTCEYSCGRESGTA